MRKRSKKAQELYDTYRESRENFLSEMRWCANCGTTEDLSCHEIAAGKNRLRAFRHRELWLALCWPCNADEFTDKLLWPYAKQLALKFLVDPNYFDLQLFRKVMAPEGCPDPPIVVTGEEVLEHLQKFVTKEGRWKL